MSKPSRHFAALDGFRGVAALAVMVFHASIILKLAYRPAHATLAVDFFFCLSGFVIAHAYDGAFAQGRVSLGSFTVKRVARLYPMILLGTLLGMVATMISAAHGAPQSMSRVLLLSVFSALLLPGGVLFHLQTFPITAPLWSLFFEVIANLVYGVEAAHGGRRRPALGLIALTAVVLVAVAVIYRSTDLGFEGPSWLVGGLARVTFSFLAGILISRAKLHLRVPRIPDLVLAAILTAVLFGPSIRFNLAYDLVAIIFVFPVIVACGAHGSSSPVANRIWVILGELSYPLYATHEPVLRFVAKLQNHFLHAPAAAAFSLALPACVVTAAGALLVYDRPVRAWLSTKPWRLRTPAVAG